MLHCSHYLLFLLFLLFCAFSNLFLCFAFNYAISLFLFIYYSCFPSWGFLICFGPWLYITAVWSGFSCAVQILTRRGCRDRLVWSRCRFIFVNLLHICCQWFCRSLYSCWCSFGYRRFYLLLFWSSRFRCSTSRARCGRWFFLDFGCVNNGWFSGFHFGLCGGFGGGSRGGLGFGVWLLYIRRWFHRL